MGIRTLNQFFLGNREYLRWRLRNPRASYANYYVEKVSSRLDSGASHITLGNRKKAPDVFERTGVAILELLKQQGLQPDHCCVDYGCGSLRAGRHLMGYLAPGHYWGLDVTDRFFTDGINELEPTFVQEHRPNFRVISNQTLAEVRKHEVNYVVSTAVLIHVPVLDLKVFFKRIFKLMGHDTQAFIHFRESTTIEQTGKLTWAYPADFLINLLKRLGVDVELLAITNVAARPITPLAPDQYRPLYLKITRRH